MFQLPEHGTVASAVFFVTASRESQAWIIPGMM